MNEAKIIEMVEKLFDEKFGKLFEAQRKIAPNKPIDDNAEWKKKTAEFFRNLITGKAMTEGTGSAGGYLVPEEFRAEVVRLIESYGVARRLATKVPMSTNELTVPALGTSVTAYWVDEANAGTESSPTLAQVDLVAKKLMGLTVVSNELLADAKVNVVDLLANLFAEVFAYEEDKQAFTGSGSPFTGILNTTGVNVVTMGSGDTTFDKVTFDDLIDAMAKLSAGAKKGAAWFFNPTITAVLRKLKDNNGQYIWSPPVGGAPGTILGYPYYEIESMPSTSDASQADKAFIVFGNLKYLYFGDREQMTSMLAREGTVGSTSLLQTDQSALRITERVAIAVALPSAFAVIKTSAS